MGSRNYKAGTRDALVHLCQGKCYMPECDEPVIRKRRGHPIFNLEIAHIHAKEEGGPRYNPNVEVDHFDNLILLCTPDHKLIDKTDPSSFPAEELFAWKRVREGQDASALSEVGIFREADMDDFVQLLVVQLDRIEALLKRMEQYDEESVRMLRLILNRLDFQDDLSRATLNHDTANILLQAGEHFDRVNTESISVAAEELKAAVTAWNQGH